MILVILLSLLNLVCFAAATTAHVHDLRIQQLVRNMTLSEKISMLMGNPKLAEKAGYVGWTSGVPRLGVPPLRMNDGPQGFRAPKRAPGTSTQWPSGLTMAHTWNRSTMHVWGQALGLEFHNKGANVFFGPGLNIQRIANGGRSFEYLSGEDPFLGNQLVQPVVIGVQSQKVIANAKHFIGNDQEGLLTSNSTSRFGRGDRHSTSSNIDERTLREIYFPPFEGAADAGVGSFMCADSLINGIYACQNPATQNIMLKHDAGFHGFICSDYDGTRSTIDAAYGGLDIEMPGSPVRPGYFGTMLKDAILIHHTVNESIVNDKVTRILWSMAATGVLDDTPVGNATTDVTSKEHVAMARSFAASACILLKNMNNALPLVDLNLDPSIFPKLYVSVVGIAGDAPGAIYGGGGSGAVVPKSAVSVLEALRAESSSSGSVIAREVKYTNGSTIDLDNVVAGSDVVVIVLAQTSSEGKDRLTLDLPQSDLVSEVSKIIKNSQKQCRIVVVTISPGPYLTNKWSSHADAIIDMGFPGEQEGNALVDILLGRINPAGKLPHTMPNVWNEVNMTERQYPGIPPSNLTKERHCGFVPPSNPPNAKFVPCLPTEAYYDEKMLIGYRWYEHYGVVPSFAFGHGLSYTTFSFSGMSIVGAGEGGEGGCNVTVMVTNTGNVEGSEVAQLYVTYPEDSDESTYKQLRGFAGVQLAPGASSSVTFVVTKRWISAWMEEKEEWEVVRGMFTMSVGSASDDIRQEKMFLVN